MIPAIKGVRKLPALKRHLHSKPKFPTLPFFIHQKRSTMRTLQFLISGIIIMSLTTGCGKIAKMHQKAYDLSEAGNYHEALGLYEKMLEEKPNKPLILNDYGWTLFMSDSLEAAVSMLEKAKSSTNEGGSILRRNIKKNLRIASTYIQVKGHLQQGNPEKAKELLDEIDRSWKTREMKLKYYALVYENMGNESKAREFWQRIMQFYPDDGERNHFQKLASTRIKQ
jgi:Tfp pilus assembly protein PilF